MYNTRIHFVYIGHIVYSTSSIYYTVTLQVKFGGKSSVGRGGMSTKCAAAMWAVENQVSVVIANGTSIRYFSVLYNYCVTFSRQNIYQSLQSS